MLGVPAGLSGKWYLSQDTALDFGLGVWHRFGRDREGFHMHADFLWHPVVLAKPEPFWLPLYVGVGGRFFTHDSNFRDDHLGVRGLIGIAMDFQRVPIDIFLEFALVIDIISDAGHGYSDFNGAIGIRYYF